MEIVIGLIVLAAAGYFIFFRKTEETVASNVEQPKATVNASDLAAVVPTLAVDSAAIGMVAAAAAAPESAPAEAPAKKPRKPRAPKVGETAAKAAKAADKKATAKKTAAKKTTKAKLKKA